MSRQSVKIIIGLILVLIVGGAVYMKSQSNSSTSIGTSVGSEQTQPEVGEDDEDDFNGSMSEPPPPPTPNPTTSPNSGTSDITLAQVAQHSGRSSCWSSINGEVYDLTSWIPNHPGGEQAILAICGKDGSGYFNAQHGSSRKVKTILTGFKVGTLK